MFYRVSAIYMGKHFVFMAEFIISFCCAFFHLISYLQHYNLEVRIFVQTIINRNCHITLTLFRKSSFVFHRCTKAATMTAEKGVEIMV